MTTIETDEREQHSLLHAVTERWRPETLAEGFNFAMQIDADNRLVWRMNPRRLDVEAWPLEEVKGEF